MVACSKQQRADDRLAAPAIRMYKGDAFSHAMLLFQRVRPADGLGGVSFLG